MIAFVILAVVVIGIYLDNAGFKQKHDPEKDAALRAAAQEVHDKRYAHDIAAEARAIVGQELRAARLQAEVERLRAERLG